MRAAIGVRCVNEAVAVVVQPVVTWRLSRGCSIGGKLVTPAAPPSAVVRSWRIVRQEAGSRYEVPVPTLASHVLEKSL